MFVIINIQAWKGFTHTLYIKEVQVFHTRQISGKFLETSLQFKILVLYGITKILKN